MENGLIKSVYDLEEKPESIGRRDFLKKAGIAGLALAGLGSLGGCAINSNIKVAGRDFNKYDFDAIAKEYETGKRSIIPINSIEDFALSGEELGWMRLSERDEKLRRTSIFSSNPLKGKDNKWNLGGMIKDFPSCEEWFLAQYEGRTNYPRYPFDLIANKFNSEKEFFEAKEKLKIFFSDSSIIHKKVIESLYLSGKKDMIAYKKWRSQRTGFYLAEIKILSKPPFIIGIDSFFHGKFYSKSNDQKTQIQEHLSRTNLYQKKRGLDLVWTDF